jgi:hypothetical protein
MSDEEGESRSERLRRRRSQRQQPEKDDALNDRTETGGTDPPSETASSSQPSQSSEPSNPSRPSVKEEQTPVYMYLPESQTRELKRLYNVLKAEYEYEYDEDFEKNRHFYPLLVQYGLDGLEGSNASELRERLASLSEPASEG